MALLLLSSLILLEFSAVAKSQPSTMLTKKLPTLTLVDKWSSETEFYFLVECTKDTAFGTDSDMKVFVLENNGSKGMQLGSFRRTQKAQQFFGPDERADKGGDKSAFVRLVCEVDYYGILLRSNPLLFGKPPIQPNVIVNGPVSKDQSDHAMLRKKFPKLTLADKRSSTTYYFVECTKDTDFGTASDMKVFVLENDGSKGLELRNYGRTQKMQQFYGERRADKREFARLVCEVDYNGIQLTSEPLLFGKPPIQLNVNVDGSELIDQANNRMLRKKVPKLTLADKQSSTTYFFVECTKDTDFGTASDMKVFVLENNGNKGMELRNYGRTQKMQQFYGQRGTDKREFARLVCEVDYKGIQLKSEPLLFGKPPSAYLSKQ